MEEKWDERMGVDGDDGPLRNSRSLQAVDWTFVGEKAPM